MKAICLLLGFLFMTAGLAAQQVDPQTQINWPANCNAAGMVYNLSLNNCIPTSNGPGGGGIPAGANGETQINKGGVFGSIPTLNLLPSGDTTGATDQAALVAALATGKRIFITKGNYYFTGNISISSPPELECAGQSQTYLYLTSATNNFFNISYGGGSLSQNTSISQGAHIRGCTLAPASGVTPTAGYGFNISGVSSSAYLSNLIIENTTIMGLCGGWSIGSFVFIDWFVNNAILNVVGSSGCHGIYLNDAVPAGDLHFDSNELGGTGSDILIHQSDVNEFTNLKLNGAGIVFDNSADRVRFLNPSWEGTGGGQSHPYCGINFTGTAANILDVSVTGGAIDLMPHAFCANGQGTLNPSANSTRFSYNTIIYSTADGITGNVSSPNLFSLNGAAPSGHCLIGNGTNYVDSATCGAAGGGMLSAATPVLSPAPGSYTGSQNVSITCASGAPYYTTGTAVTAYSAPVAISANTTLQSGCYGFGYNTTPASGNYVIAPLQAQDQFAGTNGTTLASHTDLQGHSWAVYPSNTSSGQTMTLNGSNAVTGSGTAAATISYLNSLTPSSANYITSANFTVVNNATFVAYVYARTSSGALTTYWFACSSSGGGTCTLTKAVSGATTTLGSYSLAWPNGTAHTLGVQANGTAISGLIDGTAVVGPITDSAVSATGQAGFAISGGGSVTATNFTVQ